MTQSGFYFADFHLDPDNRQLSRDEVPVELNARYLDALILLVIEAGRLVSKDRFLDQVWNGVPVTDEALTQCIRTLRRQLGDEASRPHFIETVPKHGYRFIAPVRRSSGKADPEPALAAPVPSADQVPSPPTITPAGALPDSSAHWRRLLATGSGAMIGGGLAGLIGGLFYGFAGASDPLQPGMGAASVLLVMVCLTILAALAGAAGVGFGVAAVNFASRSFGPWSVFGGAVGGLIVGGFAKLLGLDAFNLLLGQSPGDITGAAEGAVLGGSVGLGAWLAGRKAERSPLRRTMIGAGTTGALGGLIVSLSGGRLMGGSLDLLARAFPGSRLRLDLIGAWFGEQGFGPISALVTACLEGLLFGAFLVGAMILARRSLSERDQS